MAVNFRHQGEREKRTKVVMQHMHYYLINHSFTSLKTNVHGSDHSESYCYNYITVNDTPISVQPPLESCIKKYHMGHWYVEYKKKEVKGKKKP